MHQERREQAEAALRRLGPSRDASVLLAVHCADAHHVATVYGTELGPVYAGVLRTSSHGARDRHDSAHHGGHRDRPWVDVLQPADGGGTDDALPAGCECGRRSLSRALLLQAIAVGTRRMVID